LLKFNGGIVGFSRCEGNKLKRTAHKVEFEVCVLNEYLGYGIGKNLLKESIHRADSNEVKKITLNVLETNDKAIKLYKKYGFEVEGILAKTKFYRTIITIMIYIKKKTFVYMFFIKYCTLLVRLT
jgi:ribosomal protein S18 acetylase RimI-like enzyme